MAIRVTPSVVVTDVPVKLFETQSMVVSRINGFITIKNTAGGAGANNTKTVFIGNEAVLALGIAAGFPVAANEQVTIPATFGTFGVYGVCAAGKNSTISLLIVE